LWKPPGALDEDGQKALEDLRRELQERGADSASADKAARRIEHAARMYVAGRKAASDAQADAKALKASLSSLSKAATKFADLLRPESVLEEHARSVRRIPPGAFEAIRNVQMMVLRRPGKFSVRTMTDLAGDAIELAVWARAAEAELSKTRGPRSPLASGLMRRVQADCSEATGKPTAQTTKDGKSNHYALEALVRIVRSVERTIDPPLSRSGADLLTGDVWKGLASKGKKPLKK
jgi:hypothetical protein